MKILLLLFLFLVLTFSPFEAFSTTKSAKIGTPQKKAEVIRKKHRKRLKYVSPPKEELTIESMPLTLPIPEAVTTALAKGKLDEAIRELRTEPPSSKSLHLLRETQKIVAFQKNKKVPKPDKHQFYQNLGIAYHNLFMFLKRNGITNKDFYKYGLKYYRKSLHTYSMSEKSEASLLIATLKASGGEVETAKNIFSKIDTTALDDNFRNLEYLAAYYAAIGDSPSAIEKLKEARAKNPEEIAIWLAIGDDFMAIENEPGFKTLISQWKTKK